MSCRRGSVLEPREQLPERVVCRRNERRLTPSSPELRPGHVRPQALSDPTARGVRWGDERSRQGEPPRSLFAFEAASAAAGSDEVADLVQRDEVAHLATDGRHADLEPALATAVTMANADHDGAASAIDTPDSVDRAQVVDVEVEGLRLHPASVVRFAGGRQLACERVGA